MEGRLSLFLAVRGLLVLGVGAFVLWFHAAFIWARYYWWYPGVDVLAALSTSLMAFLSLALAAWVREPRPQRSGLIWSSTLQVVLGIALLLVFTTGGGLWSMGPPLLAVQDWWILTIVPGSFLVATGACGYVMLLPGRRGRLAASEPAPTGR